MGLILILHRLLMGFNDYLHIHRMGLINNTVMHRLRYYNTNQQQQQLLSTTSSNIIKYCLNHCIITVISTVVVFILLLFILNTYNSYTVQCTVKPHQLQVELPLSFLHTSNISHCTLTILWSIVTSGVINNIPLIYRH